MKTQGCTQDSIHSCICTREHTHMHIHTHAKKKKEKESRRLGEERSGWWKQVGLRVEDGRKWAGQGCWSMLHSSSQSDTLGIGSAGE